ncbi:hypothetical protein [Sorangium sp. So ce394]|uniref:hypothetical protein n=1 Tax=Sorangium sp. So ce394 TaxID=3133310 RepID=UPI003F5BC680
MKLTPYVLAAWRKCADEHQRCRFVGTHTVAYGAGDQWFYRTATNGIDCNNDTFGDPAFGIFKACYITD